MAKQLAAVHIDVVGVILIDSPSPKYRVPLSAAIVDAIVSPNAVGRVTEAVKLTKQQFLMNSQILVEYDPEATSGSYPRIVFLRCVEGYNSVGVDVPLWFSDRKNVKAVTDDWEGIVGQPVQVLDIPGHHFEAFSSANVRCHLFFSFALWLTCNFRFNKSQNPLLKPARFWSLSNINPQNSCKMKMGRSVLETKY